MASHKRLQSGRAGRVGRAAARRRRGGGRWSARIAQFERKETPEPIVALSERLSERSNRVMGELAELGAVRPRLLADDAIELRPWPASPELSQKVTEIFWRARMQEVRPWVWGIAKADDSPRPRSSRAVRMRMVAALALVGALVGAFVGFLRFRRARWRGSALTPQLGSSTQLDHPRLPVAEALAESLGLRNDHGHIGELNFEAAFI